MFDEVVRAGVIARFDELMERHHPSATAESAVLVERICSAARAENRAAAAQLVAIGELFVYRLSRCSETEDWAIDTMEAVAAEVGAALRISQGLAASRVRYARTMRERLPTVAEIFKAGDIDYRMFQTIVYRTDLITDPDVLAAVDAEVAVKLPRWPSMSRGRLSGQVDKIVARVDLDAVRRRQERVADREVWIGDGGEGISEIHGSLFTPDAHALAKRLEALAATVCEHDPRSREQRRADALGALAALVASEVLVTLNAATVVQPYLPTRYWLAWIDFFRQPVFWRDIQRGFGIQAVYVVVFLAAAWANFSTKDITA